IAGPGERLLDWLQGEGGRVPCRLYALVERRRAMPHRHRQRLERQRTAHAHAAATHEQAALLHDQAAEQARSVSDDPRETRERRPGQTRGDGALGEQEGEAEVAAALAALVPTDLSASGG